MVRCSQTKYDSQCGNEYPCPTTALLEVRGYIQHGYPEENVSKRDYSFWFPSCVDCFSEMLHEGPKADGADNQDGWEVRFLVAPDSV